MFWLPAELVTPLLRLRLGLFIEPTAFFFLPFFLIAAQSSSSEGSLSGSSISYSEISTSFISFKKTF